MKTGFSRLSLGLCVALALGTLSAYSLADELDDLLGEDFSLEDDLFEDELVIDQAGAMAPDSRGWHLSGSVQLASQYSTKQRDVGSARSGLNLALEATPHPDWYLFAELKGRYDAIEQSSGINGLETGEVYARYTLGQNTDLAFGRQLLTWGKGDGIRVNDILNPMDLREPGIVDIADSKLPVVMTRVDHYRGDWQLQGVLLHESRMSLQPEPQSDFYPLPKALPSHRPEHGWQSFGEHQYALALKRSARAGDFGLYLGDVYDYNGYYQKMQTPNGPRPQSQHYERVKHLGSGFTGVLGSWAYKAELAYRKPEVNSEQFKTMLGFDYTGWASTSFTLELGNTYLFTPADGQEQNQTQISSRIGRNFLNERLETNLLLLANGLDASGGGLGRLNLLWQQTDDLKLEGGVVAYHNGDLPMFDSENNRVYAKVNYYF